MPAIKAVPDNRFNTSVVVSYPLLDRSSSGWSNFTSCARLLVGNEISVEIMLTVQKYQESIRAPRHKYGPGPAISRRKLNEAPRAPVESRSMYLSKRS